MRRKELGILRRYCSVAPELTTRAKEGDGGAEGGEAKEGEITGRAIVFGQETVLYSDDEEEIREVIAPEAVPRELLDRSVILMTLYHNPERVLARSRNGEGTLAYEVDAEGVRFAFTPPDTEDGRTARELVGRGDITGCSFAFRCRYGDPECVKVEQREEDGRKITVCTVMQMESIHDFTLTPTPAYEQTEVEARGLAGGYSGHTRGGDSAGKEATEQRDESWREEAERLKRESKHIIY